LKVCLQIKVFPLYQNLVVLTNDSLENSCSSERKKERRKERKKEKVHKRTLAYGVHCPQKQENQAATGLCLDQTGNK